MPFSSFYAWENTSFTVELCKCCVHCVFQLECFSLEILKNSHVTEIWYSLERIFIDAKIVIGIELMDFFRLALFYSFQFLDY